MPNLKAIKRKISSIRNTRQITKAMKMVAGSKLKKSQSAMNGFRPYAFAYGETIETISKNTVLYSHPFYGPDLPRVKNAGDTGIIIISTDRGLCGSFNINLFKLVNEELLKKETEPHRVKLYILGKKAVDFFKKSGYGAEFGRFYSEAADAVSLSEELSDAVLKDFAEKETGTVYLASNEYISTLHQKAAVEKILPFRSYDAAQNAHSAGYLIDPVIYEDEIIDKIFKNYVRAKIYYKIVESMAAEQP